MPVFKSDIDRSRAESHLHILLSWGVAFNVKACRVLTRIPQWEVAGHIVRGSQLIRWMKVSLRGWVDRIDPGCLSGPKSPIFHRLLLAQCPLAFNLILSETTSRRPSHILRRCQLEWVVYVQHLFGATLLLLPQEKLHLPIKVWAHSRLLVFLIRRVVDPLGLLATTLALQARCGCLIEAALIDRCQ